MSAPSDPCLLTTVNDGQTAPAPDPAEAAVAFWRSWLRNCEPLLAFPTDLPRPPDIIGNSAMLPVSITGDQAMRLRQCAAHIDAGLDEILLAAFQVFLFRYSGARDIVVGVPAGAGADAESIPLSQPIDSSMPFSALIEATRERREQLLQPAAQIFAGIVDRLAEVSQTSHAPVFQHRFSYHCADTGSLGQLDTHLSAIEADDGIGLFLRYNTTLFAAASAERWVRNFVTMLDAIAADPETPIGALQILDQAERRFIRECLDHSGGELRPRYPSVPAMFEVQFAKTPDAVALRCGPVSLTYAELDARANAIARHLRAQGVAAGDLVGICTARTPDMIAGVLGILKLGAAYVPMDLAYPVKRLEAIAVEARLRWLLCDRKGSGLLMSVDLVEINLTEIAAVAPPPEPVPIDDDALCHVIFTSGSTGKPKGVMTRHRNVLAFMEWLWETFSPQDLAAVLCCSSLCFDMTVFEIWGPLSTGGAIVLVENGAALVERPEAQLSLVTTVPTSVRLMVDEKALAADIRVVIACGEPLDTQLVADIFAAYPGVTFYNTYGPTEDTVFSTWYRVPGPGGGNPPIGIPIVHEFGKIVDSSDKLVPVGAIGELLMGGAGVAEGYVNNPEQTARSFQQATDYGGNPAAIYRTGDFVRLGNDGQIHFVGRKDDQVKLRGFRIDLGDVAAAVGALDGVLDCRVQVLSQGEGEVLVAYVSHADVAPGVCHDAAIAAALEQSARARLPAYMVPSHFVLFHKLPLNENGKVDRTRLRSVPLSAKPASTSAPLSEDERVIAEVWHAVLGVEDIGRDDDFFLLGGNSIQAVRMVSRLNKAFSTSLDGQMVFEDRTIARIAERIRQTSGEGLPVLQRFDLADGVAPTFPQQAILMDPHKASFNMCSALRIDGALDEDALARALAALVQRHDALRAVFRVNGFDARMKILPEVAPILRVVSVDNEEGALAEAAAERRHRFDLQNDPPIRALLLRIAPDRHVFVLSIHHVVADEWSINVVRHELAALYDAERGRAAVDLPPVPVRFVDFVHWQGLLFEAGAFQRQMAYWAGEFASIVVDGAFPASGYKNGPIMAFRSLVPRWDSAARVRAAVGRHGSTPYVLWLSALHLSLVACTGMNQQVIWSPIAWRSEADLEDSLGLYSNLSVIAACAMAGQSARDFIAGVDAKVAEARRNGAVSALTAIMRDPTALPQLPMVGFNFIELPDEAAWRFSGAQATPFALRVEEEADLCSLELTARVSGDAIELELAYDTRLFGAAMVDRIITGLWEALEGFGDEPDRPLGEMLDSLRGDALVEVS